MSIRHVREAFDQEAVGYAISQNALMQCVEGVNQVITITAQITYQGNPSVPPGAVITKSSPKHPMSDDPNEVAREVARDLIAWVKGSIPSSSATPPAAAVPIPAAALTAPSAIVIAPIMVSSAGDSVSPPPLPPNPFLKG